MYKLFSSGSIISIILLAGLGIVLWIPCFHPFFINFQDLIFQSIAREWINGESLYTETGGNVAPLMVLFHAVFILLFNSKALYFIKIFNIVYLIICSFLFNNALRQTKLIEDKSYLPAFFFIVFGATPWFQLGISGGLLSLLPTMLAFYTLNVSFGEGKKPFSGLMITGILAGIIILIDFHGFWILLSLLFSYIGITKFKLKEFLIIVLFSFFIIALFLLILYFSHNTSAFFANAILINFDLLFNYEIDFFSQLTSQDSSIRFLIWCVFLLVSLICFIAFRTGKLKVTIKQWKIENLFGTWIITSILLFLFSLTKPESGLFYYVLPPFVFYVSKAFDLKFGFLIKEILLLMVIAIPALIYSLFYFCATPDGYRIIEKQPVLSSLPGYFYHKLTKDSLQEPAKKFLQTLPAHKTLLVLGNNPEFYYESNRRCSGPYIDFKTPLYRWDLFPWNETFSRFSGKESLPELYEQFEKERPDIIIDSGGYFKYLNAKLPLLFAEYYPVQFDPYIVYLKHKP